jgi:cardiolipin synthase
VYALVVIGTIFVVVTENRNPIRTLAWILVLIYLPAIGILCYYIFGQVDWKARRLSREYNQRSKEISLQISFAHNQKKLKTKYWQLSQLLEETCSAPVIEGSEVEVITKGTRKIDQLLADIM